MKLLPTPDPSIDCHGMHVGLATGQSDQDPPSRVARLSYLSGSVSFQPGGVDDWAAASLNYPLTTGDRLWTEDNARAELHVGSAAVRLGPSTSFSFLTLDDRTVQISFSEGSLLVRLRDLDDGDVFEVDTPNLAVSLVRPGEYRIDARPDGDTSVTVRSGEAEATRRRHVFDLRPPDGAGHRDSIANLRGLRRRSARRLGATGPRERDRREDESASARYVSRETIGYEDLDQYGAWRTIPRLRRGLGASRRRRRLGAVPLRPLGLGRALGLDLDRRRALGIRALPLRTVGLLGGRWFWVPGEMVRRPVYAPALVAFVGALERLLRSAAVRGVAWFPLGPREVYRPGYHASETYIRRVNVVNVVNVTNVRYVNQRIPGAVTAVSRDTFIGARPVARAAIRVPASAVASQPAVGAVAQFVPRRESMLARPAGDGTVRRPPVAAVTRTVVTRRAPPPPPASRVTTNEPPAPRPSYRIVAPRGCPAGAPAPGGPSAPSSRSPPRSRTRLGRRRWNGATGRSRSSGPCSPRRRRVSLRRYGPSGRPLFRLAKSSAQSRARRSGRRLLRRRSPRKKRRRDRRSSENDKDKKDK